MCVCVCVCVCVHACVCACVRVRMYARVSVCLYCCCPTVCPIGTHGLNCSVSCTCKNGATCNHTDGACTCQPGYVGTDCEKSKILFTIICYVAGKMYNVLSSFYLGMRYLNNRPQRALEKKILKNEQQTCSILKI